MRNFEYQQGRNANQFLMSAYQLGTGDISAEYNSPLAIYTRVSTNQGLEQNFNSLDAQYDGSQAYIRSQAHAGWTLIRARYDDGGFSGGNTERPALQRLLLDVRAGKVDVIVVYKVRQHRERDSSEYPARARASRAELRGRHDPSELSEVD